MKNNIKLRVLMGDTADNIRSQVIEAMERASDVFMLSSLHNLHKLISSVK